MRDTSTLRSNSSVKVLKEKKYIKNQEIHITFNLHIKRSDFSLEGLGTLPKNSEKPFQNLSEAGLCI